MKKRAKEARKNIVISRKVDEASKRRWVTRRVQVKMKIYANVPMSTIQRIRIKARWKKPLKSIIEKDMRRVKEDLSFVASKG